jgi:hypothetical protein
MASMWPWKAQLAKYLTKGCILNRKNIYMKKNLFFATLFIAGAATAGIAQLSTDANKMGTNASLSQSINFQDTIKPGQDTLKPAQDTTKPAQDSSSVRF